MRNTMVASVLAVAAILVWVTGAAITRSQGKPLWRDPSPPAAARPGPLLTPIPQVGRTGSALAFRPDGTQLATASEDSVLVWDVGTGAVAARFEDPVTPHRDGIITYSPDGAMLAYSGDRGVIVADARTHEVIADLGDPGEAPEAMAFSREAGKTRSLYAVFFAKLAMWDTERWASIVPPQAGTWRLAPALAAHPNGHYLALADRKQRRIYVIHEAGGEEPRVIDCGDEAGAGAAFCELHLVCWQGNRDVILARDKNRRVSLWDIRTGKAVPQRSGLQDTHAAGVALCPSRPLLAVWNSPHLATLEGLDGLSVWDCETGEKVGEFGRGTMPTAAVWSHDGHLLASADGRAVRLWDPDKGEQVGTLGLCAAPFAWFPAVSPDGRMLACTVPGGRVAVWDLAQGRLSAMPGLAMASTAELGFSRDGSRVVAADAHLAAVWEAALGKPVTAIELPDPAFVTAAALAPDNRVLAVASRQSPLECCSLEVHDATNGKPIRRLVNEAQRFFLRTLSFTPDGTRLLVSGLGEMGQQWPRSHLALIDAQTGAVAWERSDGVSGANGGPHLTADGRRIIAESAGRLTVLDTLTGATVDEPRLPFRANGTRLAPDGQMLLCTSRLSGAGPQMHLLEPLTWQAISERPLALRGLPAPGARGLWFAVARPAGIDVCDTRTGAVRVTLWAPPAPDDKGRPTWDGDWLAFTPDGYYTGSEGAQRHLRFRDEEGKLHTADSLPHLHDPGRVRKALTQ